jgi:hypothetical protein
MGVAALHFLFLGGRFVSKTSAQVNGCNSLEITVFCPSNLFLHPSLAVYRAQWNAD